MWHGAIVVSQCAGHGGWMILLVVLEQVDDKGRE